MFAEICPFIIMLHCWSARSFHSHATQMKGYAANIKVYAAQMKVCANQMKVYTNQMKVYTNQIDNGQPREGNKKEDMNYADDSDFFIYKSVPSRSSRLLKKSSDSCSFRSDFLTLFQYIFLLQRSIWSILHLKNHGATLQHLQCMPLILGNMNAIIS